MNTKRVNSTFILNFLCKIKVKYIFQTCQREIKRLREKELALQSDLANASKEILRLRELLKEYTAAGSEGSAV